MNGKIFKRKIYSKLLEWKNNRNGKSALLIEGARRIGKSTIVEEFAKNEYETYIIIDFSNLDPKVNALFDEMYDLDSFFLRLQFFTNVTLYERKSLIVFDEVQFRPEARQAIKHLVAHGKYDYIETGSLISIRKNVEKILIPSEETKLEMYPMDYEEFRWALGDETTPMLLRDSFEKRRSLGDDLNRKLMRDFRLYMLIGGMPQVVDVFLETNNFTAVDNQKRDILSLYEEDFNKIDITNKATKLFDNIPSQLSKNKTRYRINGVLNNQAISQVIETINNMEDSKTVNIAYNVSDPGVGMNLSVNTEAFKLFLLDTGLFITLAFKEKDITENVIYEQLLSDKLSVNLGYVYENVVAQMLKASGNDLFYYTFKNENSNHYSEIDFLISRKNKICPIEVKASGYKRHASLDKFSVKFSNRIGEKYLVYTKDLRKDGDLIMLPVYMVPFI
ncbi:MAG: AAA family ATPase [Lachnospiraceae bacterium]|jgi:predicted AAA+ superfamily ATPase|nr:AAA family ATPase [Lachnospiraceae bacterium]